MPFVLGVQPLLPQHVLVLDGIDGGNPELHLGQNAQALWLGHLSVLILQLVKCVAAQPKNSIGHSGDLERGGSLEVWLRALCHAR